MYNIRRFLVDFDKSPAQFPTHRHPAEFWEALGRVVATFGFLEETLGKAIFSFTATRQYPETEIKAAYERWLPTLQQIELHCFGIGFCRKARRDSESAAEQRTE